MSGSKSSSEDKEIYATLDDILVLADMALPIVNEHIRMVLEKVGNEEGGPEGTITSTCTDAIALDLIHGAFIILLARQLKGKDLENLNDTLQKATGYMNLAANRVIVNIPGNITTPERGPDGHPLH